MKPVTNPYHVSHNPCDLKAGRACRKQRLIYDESAPPRLAEIHDSKNPAKSKGKPSKLYRQPLLCQGNTSGMAYCKFRYPWRRRRRLPRTFSSNFIQGTEMTSLAPAPRDFTPKVLQLNGFVSLRAATRRTVKRSSCCLGLIYNNKASCKRVMFTDPV